MKDKSDFYLGLIILVLWILILNQCRQTIVMDEIRMELSNINHTLQMRL